MEDFSIEDSSDQSEGLGRRQLSNAFQSKLTLNPLLNEGSGVGSRSSVGDSRPRQPMIGPEEAADEDFSLTDESLSQGKQSKMNASSAQQMVRQPSTIHR